MKYKISVPQDITLAALEDEIALGGRFVVYAYCISLLFAVTLKRMSKAYLILHNEPADKYKDKYNKISYFFGWWAIPWGIIRTMEYTKLNNNGGLDVTKDIMLNISEESLNNKEVILAMVHTIFKVPETTEIESFKKAVFKKLPASVKMEEMVVGYFLNVEQGQRPYFLVGFRCVNGFEAATDALAQALYTQFYKHTPFQFTNQEDDSELNNLLREQGLKLV